MKNLLGATARKAGSLLLVLAGVARAEPSQPSVEKVLDFFQTSEFLGDGLKCMDEALARRKKEIKIPESQAQNIAGLSKRIYPPQNLYKTFKGSYAKAISLENMTAVYNWTLTTKGARLRQGLSTAYKATPKARSSYFTKQSPVFLKPNRRNALSTFMTNFEQDQVKAVFELECDFGVLMAMNGYAAPASRDSVKYLKDKVADRKTGYQSTARDLLMPFDFYVLKDLKNEDIDELSKFASSAIGQAHTKAFTKALEVTLDGAAKTLQDQIIKPTK